MARTRDRLLFCGPGTSQEVPGEAGSGVGGKTEVRGNTGASRIFIRGVAGNLSAAYIKRTSAGPPM